MRFKTVTYFQRLFPHSCSHIVIIKVVNNVTKGLLLIKNVLVRTCMQFHDYIIDNNEIV